MLKLGRKACILLIDVSTMCHPRGERMNEMCNRHNIPANKRTINKNTPFLSSQMFVCRFFHLSSIHHSFRCAFSIPLQTDRNGEKKRGASEQRRRQQLNRLRWAFSCSNTISLEYSIVVFVVHSVNFIRFFALTLSLSISTFLFFSPFFTLFVRNND